MARKPAPRAGRKANPARGEHAITLAGVEYLLRPSHEACQAIEDELDLSNSRIMALANMQALTTRQLGIIYAELIRAGADEADTLTKGVSATRIAELLFEEGTAKAYPQLAMIYVDIITGGRDAEGNAKAGAEMTTPTPAPATAA